MLLVHTTPYSLQIEFPVPDAKTKRRIFTIHTSRMTFSDDVNLEEFIMAKVCVCVRAHAFVQCICAL
eukprot:scaffold56767_cov16-Tisochrysis_lutea.AAC.1